MSVARPTSLAARSSWKPGWKSLLKRVSGYFCMERVLPVLLETASKRVCGPDARLDAQGEGLGEKDADAEADEVVDDLADGPGAEVAAVHGLVPDEVEDGLVPLVGGAAAADHDAQGRVLGPRSAAADRGVQHLQAHGLPGGGDAVDRVRVGGAQVEEGGSGAGAADDAALSHRHLLHVLGPGQRGEDDLAGLGHPGRAVRPGGPHGEKLLGGLPADVEDRYVVASLGDVPGHVPAHVSETYESDLHVCPPSRCRFRNLSPSSLGGQT